MKLTSFVEYLLEDAFRELDHVEVKRMFGGYAFYLDGRIFGFTIPEHDGTEALAFKSNEESKSKFEELGGTQFTYHGHKTKPPVNMPYWRVPSEVLEDPVRLAEWARVSASLSKKKTK